MSYQHYIAWIVYNAWCVVMLCSSQTDSIAPDRLSKTAVISHNDAGIYLTVLHPDWVRASTDTYRTAASQEESIQGSLQTLGQARADIHGKILSKEGKIQSF